jgi:chromosomal replication initiator protein
MSNLSPQSVWETALGQLQLQVTRSNYDTWLRDTVGLRLDDCLFVVGAPSDFATEWLSSRLQPLITKTLAGILRTQVSVSFQVIGSSGAAEDVTDRAPSPSMSAEPSWAGQRASPRYTFASFVVGEENEVAYRASLLAAELSEHTYNPLFLCGSPGLGKTHLLHAIADRAASKRRTILTSAEQFVNDFVTAYKNHTLDHFRNCYRRCELLLIDDIQFLEAKTQTQEEFFHTFNDLHSADTQIVLTSERPPAVLSGLAERLRSRLHAGLLVEILPPALATRVAILQAKAAELQVTLPSHVLSLMAEMPAKNVRDLEGSLNRVVALVQLTRQPMSPELATRALQPFAPPADSSPTADHIISTVCDRFGFSADMLSSSSRNRHLSYARHLAMYLLRHEAHLSLQDIGAMLGRRDHSTIIQACRRIEREVESLPQTRQDLASLRASLRDSAA